MPTPVELQSIVDYGGCSPPINESYFPNTVTSDYWSSTSLAAGTGDAWRVGYGNGNILHYGKGCAFSVRAVRRGHGSLGHLISNSDGTVSDTKTGLMWQKTGSVSADTWKNAVRYCENLNEAGYLDWRMPTAKELASIVKLDTYNPSIDTAYFNAQPSNYWSSTAYANNTGYAWRMDFVYGYFNYSDTSNTNYVRAVRAGQSVVVDHLLISSPEQASSWEPGRVMPITWEPRSIAGDVKISLSRDGGKTYMKTIAATPNDGSHDWTVTVPESVNCMLKIEPVDDASKGTIQGLFSIRTHPPGDYPGGLHINNNVLGQQSHHLCTDTECHRC
jgi:hypothetical protein